ncbi:MAG TPA: ABC-F family ATP-binding cassette domain-containing protein [Candidatus Hydrogenedentes bacterium]|nr:ABC-F family ATP-binding cassette domain-containing protein [Candidatus Hydrogenedentota bacterium]HOS02881.1 ABC-F family ATP-binding cassette domain-containing protein [Candidatus Hydrogenedentota bacterium]
MSSDRTTAAILSVQAVSKRYGAQQVLDSVSLTIHEGDRIGLIGSNGSGKSTLLRIMTGMEAPEDGIVTRMQGLRVAMLEQQCRIDPSLSVGEVLQHAGDDVKALLDEYHALSSEIFEIAPGTSMRARAEARFAALEHELELTGAWNAEHDIRRVGIALDLPEPTRGLASLSGGELRRVDLAATILRRPDLLLLDEPTNHIDVRSAAWIEEFLQGYGGSCILVTHDRYFLDRIVNRIVEIEFTKLVSYPGNYERFLEYKALRQDHEARSEANRRATMRRELAWLRRGPKARATKQKARIDRYYELEDLGPPPTEREFTFQIPHSRRLGKQILEIDKIARSYGDKALFRELTLIMQKEMRVGVFGPNGSGKTTLLRVLMGLEPPDSGRIVTGEATEFLYVDQSHETIDPDRSILHHISGGRIEVDVRGRTIHIPAYLESFLFDRESIRTPMRNLSGGERNRLDLAKKFLAGGNFLVLDEPTNDLDLATLRVVEEAIDAFEGCAVIVSHDRYFLNRVCTHILVFEGDGKTVFTAGGYDDYLLYCQRRAEDERERRAEEEAKAPKAPPAAKGVRLTYMEQKELAGIEALIHKAEAEASRLEEALAAPGFYEQAYATVQEALASLERARKNVDALYVRWEELEGKGKG